MDPQTLLRTSTFNADFGFKEYIVPHCSCDPKKQILDRALEDYKHKPRQGKFKVTTKPRECYFDELAKTNSAFPEPSRYKNQGNIAKKFKSSSLSKVDLNVKKRTYIDNIEAFEAKHKPPGIGKFDLTKYTDLGTRRFSNLKPNKQIKKFNNFDDAIKLAAELPGPGQFNPHETVKKLKVDRTDHKFWKNKHNSEEKRLSKSVSIKLGPSTYTPIKADTFQGLAANKSKPISRWSHGTIDIRKGMRSEMKEPSPCMYNTVHQWTSVDKKDKPIGNLDLLNRVSSARGFGVYH